MIMILGFKEWLIQEAVKLDAKRPYIKASVEFKKQLEIIKGFKSKTIYQEIKHNL